MDSPDGLVEAYACLFANRGGRIEKCEIASMARRESGWEIRDEDGRSFFSDCVAVCLGPWARRFLERFGLRAPMAFERGYNMHYSGPCGRASNTGLGRPIYDTAGAYVLSPMEQGLRLTTGVELTDCDAPKSPAQIDLAERSAREAIVLGDRLEDTPWMGRRPTLPDSRPAIGPARGYESLFFAFGHQHIGFSTGPGTARLLADLMEGRRPEIPAEPFDPSRFIR